jgi:hypothetical protein
MKLRKASIGSLRINDTSAKIQNSDILSRFNFDADNFPDMKGSLGATGFKGSIGYQGSVGSQGDTGFIGSIGFKGSLGTRGYTGSQGFTGSIGEQGYRGSVGDTGFKGSRGALGDQGFTGSRGALGITGSVGFKGSVGYRGSRGDQGYTGSLGATGFTGSKGFTGSRLGATGAIGDTGYQGSRGYTGSSTGAKGPSGDTGYKGSQGNRGATGAIGDTGFTGSLGDVGFTGSVGFRGSVGVQGSVGARGLTGFKGSRGYTGSRGFLTLEGFRWEPIRTRAASTSLDLIGSGGTAATISIGTGTIAAGDVIAMELNSDASVSTDSTPKVIMFTIANDSTPIEVEHQHGWTSGFIQTDVNFWYNYLRAFGVAYASTTSIRFDRMYSTTMFLSGTSWGSTTLDTTNLSLYGGRMWKLTPNQSIDTVANPSIGTGFGNTCTYFSFENQSTISVTVTNNHDQSAVIQFDSTSFISSNASEVVVAANSSRTFTGTFIGDISGSSRTVAARAVVGSKQSTTVTKTETISFCQGF